MLTRSELLKWLRERRESALEELWKQADTVRREYAGDAVFLRGIIEFSNVCANDCLYCGIRVSNENTKRYTIPPEEILEAAKSIERCRITTVVLQSGETPGLADDMIEDIIRRIKAETNLAITISVGNRPEATYRRWRKAGMDRYLMRFETSNAELFANVHPNCTLEERLNCLKSLRSLGVQVGSGFLIGLAGETIETLADNILLCRELDLDMIGIGPFIPHAQTPLAGTKNAYHDQPEMFFKAVALLRLCNPDAHIPATTAFDAVFPGTGRNLVLQRGANVFMPNNTPAKYRADYQLYPGKPCVNEATDQCASCAVHRVLALGRTVGTGPGHSMKKAWAARSAE